MELKVKELAESHVDWFLKIVRPLMVTEFEHGFKHGVEYANNTTALEIAKTIYDPTPQPAAKKS